jgi:hypothetical protein
MKESAMATRNIASLICEASAPVGLRWVFVVDGEKRSDRIGHDFLLVHWLVGLGRFLTICPVAEAPASLFATHSPFVCPDLLCVG